MTGFADPKLTDFRNFLFVTWKHLMLPDPTPVQYDMADALQNVVKPVLGLGTDPAFGERFPQLINAKGDPVNRMQAQAFRGVGKSWVTSALVDWCLALKPDLNIMVVSASKDRADDFTTFTLRLIKEMPELQQLMPKVEEGHRFSKQAFDVGLAQASHAPSVKSRGVMGQLAGSRADIIIADDTEVPNTAETQGMRQKLADRVREFDAILKPGGVIIYLGTPQTEDSLYVELERRGYPRVIWPARYPCEKWMVNNGPALATRLRGELDADPGLTTGGGLDGRMGQPTDPVRFNEEDLQEREASYGRSGFALQFMLDTSLSDAERYPLKLNDTMVMDMHPEMAPEHPIWASRPELRVDDVPCVGFRGDHFHRPLELKGSMIPYQGCVMAVDPSGRGKDEMAYAILKQLNGYLYLAECRGLKGGYADVNLDLLGHRAKHHKVHKILVESNFGDGMFSELLKPILRNVYPCTIEEVRHHQQKERRIIETLEPVLNQHRLIINRQVILDDIRGHAGEAQETAQHRQLFHQLTRITFDRGALRHDDRLDALSIAVNHMTSVMAQDADRKIDEREVRAWQKRERELAESSVLRKGKKTRPEAPNFLAGLRRPRA